MKILQIIRGSSHRRCSMKNMFLKVLQHLQEAPVANSWWQSLSFNSCSLQVREILEIICGSSHQRYSIKKGDVKNFVKFTGKNLWQRSLLAKRLWHRCFPLNFVKFLKTPFLTDTLRWLLLYLPGSSQNQEFSILWTYVNNQIINQV